VAIVQSPDLQYLEHHPYPANIFWLIEYADSTLVKDLTTKQKIYAQAGILEYWVVNLIAPELIVFREPGNDGYAQETKFSNGLLTALSFPDINIEVRKLFSV
jgi:Uma2 family endonuclease